MKAKLDWLLLL